MTRIKQLPTLVITKIAAGEVIERPASVVKELLENSVDAGSSRIDIEIEEGGSELIRVTDNGCGIDAEDMSLAFAGHATSKLQDADDLFRIGSLGFRGEALASIGAVAQVRLQSRVAACDLGSEITCHGGEVSPVRAWNGSPGTRIEVKHLFFNTPVRRKFLRTTSTEMGHITEIFTRMALSHPGVQLSLHHKGKRVFEIPASADLLQRIGIFFGEELVDKLYPIEMQRGDVRLFGFVADPSMEKGNLKSQYLFLNGRWIRDRSLGHALQEAYRGLLMSGRYAVAFLFFEMPPEMVDVNVHPTKAEVRFRDAQFLYSMVLSTIRNRLSAENLTARLNASSTLTNPYPKESVNTPSLYEETTASNQGTPLPPPPIFHEQSVFQSSPPASDSNGTSALESEQHHDPMPDSESAMSPALDTPPAASESHSLTNADAGPEHRAIQLYNAYLVLETLEGILVIDQHALHERILFEQLKRRIRDGTLEMQRLLVPEPIELTPEQAGMALEHREELAQLGLQIEDFGGGTILLHSYPAIIGNRSPEKCVKAVVDFLCSKDRVPAKEVLLNDLLSLMACHSAVRAGDTLTQEQIASLIAQRSLADDAHHCPHGRPTALLFSKQDLDRQFGRI